MQHIHENDGKTFLLVEVPAGAMNFETGAFFGGTYGLYWEIGDNKGIATDSCYLPSVNWQIVGKGDEATEEQAKEMVSYCETVECDSALVPFENGKVYADYYDYDRQKWYVLNTAIEALHSLLRSLHMQPERTLILQRIVS